VTIEDFYDKDSTGPMIDQLHHDAATLADIDDVSAKKTISPPAVD
jgi:hypothetical protein